MAVKKKKYKETNVVVNARDQLMFAALYRHRMLTKELLYELLFKNTNDYKYMSMSVRLSKLEAHGFIRGEKLTPKYVAKDDQAFISVKAYDLTDLGLRYAIEELDLDYNLYDTEGMVTKNHYEAIDLRIQKQLPHHFALQDMVIYGISQLIQRNPGTNFLDYEYGWGKDAVLYWDDEKNNKFNRPLYPDWMFYGQYKGPREFNQRYKIAFEADRNTMNGKQLETKLLEYLCHVKGDKLYKACPLTLIIGIDRQQRRRTKRIRSIKQNVFSTLEEVLYPGDIQVYVIDSKSAPYVIADAYERKGYEFERLYFHKIIDDIVIRNSSYRLKAKLEDYQSIAAYPMLKSSPDSEIVYSKGTGEEFRVFIVKMRKGHVNGEAKLLDLEQMIKAKGVNGIVLGVYPSKDELHEDVFMEFTNRNGQRIHIGEGVVLTSMHDLIEERGYKLDTIEENQRHKLRQVMFRDVIH